MNDIITIENLNPVAVYSGGIDALLAKIAAEAKSFTPDISTPQGRKEIASVAYKVAKSKTLLDDMGKALGEDAKRKVDAINADRKKVRDNLDALKDEVRKPLTDWENAEKARIEAHEAALVRITNMASIPNTATTADIEAALAQATAIDTSTFQEFTARAIQNRDVAIAQITAALTESRKREAEAAELAKLRAEAAARAAEEAERQRIAREEQIRTQAAEAARREAEAAVIAAQQAAIEAEAKAKADAIAAVEAERRRVAEAAAAEAAELAKREANTKHKASVNRAAAAALMNVGLTEDQAKAVVIAIYHGDIPNVKISY